MVFSPHDRRYLSYTYPAGIHAPIRMGINPCHVCGKSILFCLLPRTFSLYKTNILTRLNVKIILSCPVLMIITFNLQE